MGILMGEMQTAWNRGDPGIFAAMLEDMRAKSPADLQTPVPVTATSAWAGWIANRLAQPGTVFVAVGAGHLSGPDSVQHKLADHNIRSARLN